jgi:hypothetical protein
LKHSFRWLALPALLIVACGNETLEGPQNDMPGADPGESKPSEWAPIRAVENVGGTGGIPDEAAEGRGNDAGVRGNDAARAAADGRGEVDSNDADEPAVLALGECDLNAPFEAPVAAFTRSMNVDGLTFSADGNTAYLSGPGTGGNDIFVATRRPNGTFTVPTPVTTINTNGRESAPSLSADGRTLYLTSAPFWSDIARSEWDAVNARWGPAQAISVPSTFNSSVHDQDPFWWGSNKIYFVSERPNGEQRDIYVSTLSGTTLSPPDLVQNVNSSAEEFRPVLSPDGLTLYFSSRRCCGIGSDTGGDIFMARRTSATAAFPESPLPVNLWTLNTTGIEFPVSVSADGCTLYFASNEETGLSGSQNFRLYQAKRGASTPAQVTLRLNILGQGSITQPPFNCGPGNTGTCSASAPPDTTWLVNASAAAHWTGSCSGNGGQPSTDGVLTFAQNAVCTVKFAGAPLVGPGGLCSLSMDCQQGLECKNGTCGCTQDADCQSDQCLNAVCQPATGLCSSTLKPDGTSCNDNNACSVGDSCLSGLCLPTGGLPCNDGNFCNGEESCNRVTGCEAGEPPAIDDSIACTIDLCIPLVDLIFHTPFDDACGTGFRCDPNYGCVDTPSCEDGTHNCSPNATCTNTPEGFTCTCNPGFTGDGVTCDETCTPITIRPGVERCVIARADGSVDLYLSPTADPTLEEPWHFNEFEEWHQSQEPEVNFCGPTALKNFAAWYGFSPSYSELGDLLNTNSWDTFSVLAAAAGPCAEYCWLEPNCIFACEATAALVAEAVLDGGTLPDDMRRGMIEIKPSGYVPCNVAMRLSDIRWSLAHGNPVIYLESRGNQQLHWALITGLYFNAQGKTMVRIANAQDVDYDTFRDIVSIDRVGGGLFEWLLDELYDIEYWTTFRIAKVEDVNQTLTVPFGCPGPAFQ